MLRHIVIGYRQFLLCSAIVATVVAKTGDGLVAQPTNSDDPVEARASEPDPTQLDMKRLATVLHPKTGLKSFGIRDSEQDAYYYVLDHARKTDYQLQKQAARRLIQQRRQKLEKSRWHGEDRKPFPIFVDLFRNADNPSIYQGRLVSLEGHVRLLRQMPAGDNSYGIKTLYEAWLYTEDSQNNPACVVCTSIPPKMLEAFEQSDSHVLDHVSTTGYFFKMMGYTAQDTNRYAPLILAQRLEWQPPAPSTPLVPRQYVVVIAVAVVFLLVGIVYWITRKDQQVRKKRLEESLTEVDFTSVEDQAMEPTIDSAPEDASPEVPSDPSANDLAES